VALALVALGAAWLGSVEPGFVLLLAYPFNIIVCWVLGVRCASRSKNLLALPLFIFFAGALLSGVILYAEFTEQAAEKMAKSMCAVPVGTNFKSVIARAGEDNRRHDHVRWVQVQDKVKDGEGTLSVIYRGTNLLRLNVCELKAGKGVVLGSNFKVQ
jgi:hypothetical protein